MYWVVWPKWKTTANNNRLFLFLAKILSNLIFKLFQQATCIRAGYSSDVRFVTCVLGAAFKCVYLLKIASKRLEKNFKSEIQPLRPKIWGPSVGRYFHHIICTLKWRLSSWPCSPSWSRRREPNKLGTPDPFVKKLFAKVFHRFSQSNGLFIT